MKYKCRVRGKINLTFVREGSKEDFASPDASRDLLALEDDVAVKAPAESLCSNELENSDTLASNGDNFDSGKEAFESAGSESFGRDSVGSSVLSTFSLSLIRASMAVLVTIE